MTVEQTNKRVRKEIQGKEGNKTKLQKGKSKQTGASKEIIFAKILNLHTY
jgi:hypothetical protein